MKHGYMQINRRHWFDEEENVDQKINVVNHIEMMMWRWWATVNESRRSEAKVCFCIGSHHLRLQMLHQPTPSMPYFKWNADMMGALCALHTLWTGSFQTTHKKKRRQMKWCVNVFTLRSKKEFHFYRKIIQFIRVLLSICIYIYYFFLGECVHNFHTKKRGKLLTLDVTCGKHENKSKW